MSNIIWGGNTSDKVYLQSGTVTSTIKTSQDYSSVFTIASTMSYDGTNWWAQSTDTLYKMSGLFSAVVKDSEDVSSIDASTSGISPDLTNTHWQGSTDNKWYTNSGQITSTLLTSQSTTGTGSNPLGFDVKQADALWTDIAHEAYLYLQSGQFTSAVKTSLNISSGFNFERDVSYDGENVLSMGGNNKKLMYRSGLFSSTVKDSELVSGIDANPDAITTDDFVGRMNPPDVGTPDTETMVLAQESPTIDIINNPTILVSALSISLAIETPVHINSNHPRPEEVGISLLTQDPVIDIGQVYEATEGAMIFLQWSPTIVIETQTIVEVEELTLAAALPEPFASPEFALFASTLPMFTLNASILLPSSFASELPMFTLDASLITGQVFSVNRPLPMLTLDIRAGTKVSISLPIMLLSASGTTSNGGTLTKPLPLMTLDASGQTEGSGVFATSLPMFTVDIVMALGGIHTFASSLPMITLSSVGINGGAPGSFAAALPIITLASSGYSDGSGTLAKALPMLVLDAFGTSYTNRII